MAEGDAKLALEKVWFRFDDLSVDLLGFLADRDVLVSVSSFLAVILIGFFGSVL